MSQLQLCSFRHSCRCSLDGRMCRRRPIQTALAANNTIKINEYSSTHAPSPGRPRTTICLPLCRPAPDNYTAALEWTESIVCLKWKTSVSGSSLPWLFIIVQLVVTPCRKYDPKTQLSKYSLSTVIVSIYKRHDVALTCVGDRFNCVQIVMLSEEKTLHDQTKSCHGHVFMIDTV